MTIGPTVWSKGAIEFSKGAIEISKGAIETADYGCFLKYFHLSKLIKRCKRTKWHHYQKG